MSKTSHTPSKVRGPGSGVGGQSQYAPAHPDQQAVGRVVSGQAYDQSPAVAHHPPGQVDDAESHCLEPLVQPLAAHCQLLDRRVQVERQGCDGPPGGIGSEQPRGQPPSGKVSLENPMYLLALAATLPVPSDQLLPAMVRLVTTPDTLYQPFPCISTNLDAKSDSISMPGSGGLCIGSLTARNL